ncbi:hypothetical protein DFJ74DRAFT_764412 [Hyaloraphidium curvatum]|nr:hypothetical protein DFJ74DRAFT_764412 [Hyaloraphidium curvatum]
MARRSLLSACFRTWFLPPARDRWWAAAVRQAVLVALAYFLGSAARDWRDAGGGLPGPLLDFIDFIGLGPDISIAPRSYPGSLVDLHPVPRVALTPEEDARAAGGKWPPRKGPPRRVLFLTYEVAGPHMNGGIGTAFRNLAEALAARGHNVTVALLTGAHANRNSGKTFDGWVAAFAARGVRLEALPDHPGHWAAARVSYDVAKARQAYEWLRDREHDYDFVHFHEWRGAGYYAMEAKRLGLRFQNTLLVAGAHGPDLWAQLASMSFPGEDSHEPAYIEAKTIELADVLVSPSRYMVEWMDKLRWPLPARIVAVPNVLGGAFAAARPRKPTTVRAKEFVFFGRLEMRKGLIVFRDAMLRLQKDLGLSAFKVSLIGKVEKRSLVDDLPRDWLVMTNHSIETAHAYLLGGTGRVAVVPSLVDNSPYTVLECLAAGVPLLASDSGGTAELFRKDFLATNTFRPDEAGLYEVAKRAVEEGVPVAAPAAEPGEVAEAWGRWHESVPVRSSPPSRDVKISVVASACRVGAAEAVAAMRGPLAGAGEVVLAHKGPAPKGLDLPRWWKLVEMDAWDTAKAWNAGAKAAKGEVLLFYDIESMPEIDFAPIKKAFSQPNVDLLTIASYPKGNDTLAFSSIVPQACGASTLLLTERHVRRGRSLAVRRALFDRFGGFDLGPDDAQAVLNFLVRAEVARLPLHLLPDPVPGRELPPRFWGKLLPNEIKMAEKAIAYNALARYFPQDLGLAVIVADQKAKRDKYLVADSRKDFSQHQGFKSWWYGYRSRDPGTGAIGELELLNSSRKVCFNDWDCELRHDMGERAELGNIFIGDRKQHPMVHFPRGRAPTAYMAVRAWVATTQGDKAVHVTIKRVPGSSCGDGVDVRLVREGELVMDRLMALDLEDKEMIDDVAEFHVRVPMEIGQLLELQVDPRKNHDCDGMLVDIVIRDMKWDLDEEDQ